MGLCQFHGLISSFGTGENHHTFALDEYKETLYGILQEGASVNFYMFFGGTNFAFMNGANGDRNPPYYLPTITSYDYDAPLTESGDITAKYLHTVDLLRKHAPGFPSVLPPLPTRTEYALYGKVEMTSYYTLERMLDFVTMEMHTDVIPMELLNCNEGSGQGYGFTLYRNKIESLGGNIKIQGRVADRATVRLYNNDYVYKEVIDWLDEDYLVTVPESKKKFNPVSYTLDILVENLGRVNFQWQQTGPEFVQIDQQRKGLLNDVLLNENKLQNWYIYPLQFDREFMEAISSEVWFALDDSARTGNGFEGPAMFQGNLNIVGSPKDTYIRLEGWGKGSVFINNINVGRYWESKGPQRTLYLPAPFLKEGDNSVIVFEQHYAMPHVSFINQDILQSVHV